MKTYGRGGTVSRILDLGHLHVSAALPWGIGTLVLIGLEAGWAPERDILQTNIF